MRVRFIRDDGERLAINGASGLVDKATDDWMPAKTLRTSSFTYADADGGQMVKQHYDPWPITFSGYIVRPTSAKTTATRNELLRFFTTNHYFTAIFTDCDGVEMSAPSGWISSAPEVTLRGKQERHPTFNLELTFGDPYLYEYAEDKDGNPTYANSIEVPKFEQKATSIGYMYSGAGYIYYAGGYEYTGQINQVPTINVNSTQPVAPIWTVTGKATNPSITNLTTNTTMSYDGTIASGQTLIVDCLNQTAMIGTADVSRFLTGDWLTLAVGSNKLRYETASQSDTKKCKLSWNGVIW